jgi:hypothetical protein
MSDRGKERREASPFVGVPLGVLTALVVGGATSRLLGGCFFDPFVVVTAVVLVPAVLIGGSYLSKRKALVKETLPPGEDDEDA